MGIVRECMLPDIATFSPGSMLLDAARGMAQQAIGFAVILDGMDLVGLVTEYDIIRWMVKGHDPETTRIGDLPLSKPQIVREDTACQELLNIYYQRRFRRFPVLNDDEILSGGITEKQILASLPRSNLMAHYRVADVIPGNPPVVAPDWPYMKVARHMMDTHRGCVLILEDDRFLGMISEGDMIRFRVSPEWRPDATAIKLANTDPLTIEPERDLLYALDHFQRTRHRRVPVVTREGTLVGLLTQTDMLRQVADSARSHRAVLNPEDIPEPAIWFEPDGEHLLLAMNEKGSKALELDPELWIGRSVHDLAVDPSVWGALSTLLVNCATIENINLPLKTGNRQSICVSCDFRLVHTPTGEDRIFWTIGAAEGGRNSCG